MNLDGVMNAKAEVFADAFGFQEVVSSQSVDVEPVFAAQPGSEAFDVMERARRSGQSDARDLIALGAIVPHRDSDGAELGILIQRRRLLQHPIVERALRSAKDEARVIVTGPIRHHAATLSERCRPLVIGCSIGHPRTTAGSIGCFVRRRSDGKIGILSNNHVLADTNRALIGDAILQPGRHDGGRLGDQVATLSDVVAIAFEVNGINFVDAAVATLLDGVTCLSSRVVHATSGWTLGLTDPLIVTSQPVMKMGRTTQSTFGSVAAIGVDNLNVTFRVGSNSMMARFDQQISIAGETGPFSKPGDSGALVCSTEGRPVALLMAGSKTGGTNGLGLTFASPIDTVLDALDIDIYTAG